MKNADDEFHARKAPLLAAIAEEGLQIARSNHWPAVVIELSGVEVVAPVGAAECATASKIRKIHLRLTNRQPACWTPLKPVSRTHANW